MSADNKVPAIRFEGFSGEWEEKNLEDLCEETYGGGTPKTSINEYWEGDVPWIQSSDLIEGQVTNIVAIKNISDIAIKKSATKLIPENSIAIVTRVGVGKVSLMEKKYTTSQDFLSMSKLKVVPLYGVYSIWNKLQKEKLSVQGTSIKGITKEELLSKIIGVPGVKQEQTNIGNYFQQLDTLIAQYQQKHDKLLNLKKALLEKMFPKQGTTEPEIRFKGFSGEWENWKLGDYATFRRGSFPQPYGNIGWYGGKGAMPFVQVIDVTKKLTLVNNTKQKISLLAQPKSVLVKKGKVLVTLQGSIGRVAIAQYDTYVDRTVLIFEGFKKNTNSHYWAYIIQNKFDLEKKIAPGGTIKTITKEALAEFSVNIPKHKEQTKIGNLFKQLDTLISQHQSQLKKLANIKQACLEKMFV